MDRAQGYVGLTIALVTPPLMENSPCWHFTTFVFIQCSLNGLQMLVRKVIKLS